MSNITVNKVEEDKKIFKALVLSTFTKHRQYRFLGGLRHSFSFPTSFDTNFRQLLDKVSFGVYTLTLA